MRIWNIWARRLGIAGGIIAILCIGGCATPRLAEVSAVEDDDAAYWVFGALNRTQLQEQAARRIVQRAYLHVMQLRPDDRRRTLDEWIVFLEALERPVPVNAERYRTARELRDVRDVHLVSAYIRNNPDLRQLQGAEWNTAWRRDLENARTVVGTLRDAVEARLSRATVAVNEEDFSQALEEMLRAFNIAPQEVAVREKAQHVQDLLASRLLADMEAGIRNLDQLMPDFGTQRSDMSRIQAAEAQLVSLIDRLTLLSRSLATLRIPLSDRDVGERILEMRPRVVEFIGPVWAETIRLHGLEHDYWEAYERARLILSRIKTHSALSQSDAESVVLAAYSGILNAGVAHFLEEANNLFYRDQFGLAYIAARMSRELADFYADASGRDVNDSVNVLVQRADRTAADTTDRIRRILSRRLWVSDFVPAVTEEYENFGFQIRVRLRAAAAPGNDLVWGLEVPAPPSLPLASVVDRAPQDLLYSGRMDRKISVEHLPPRELDRGYIEVGTHRATEIPNPLFRIREGVPRIVFSQEVHLYPWVRTQHRKQARIALHVHRELDQGATRLLYSLDDIFPNNRVRLPGLAIESESLIYQTFVLGTPRIVPSRHGMDIDRPPEEAQPAQLASDSDIKKAIIDYVLEQILDRIKQEVAQYPMESLAAVAYQYQMEDRWLDAGEFWGHFLVYIEALMAADLNSEANWIARRSVMRNRIEQWCRDRWQGQPADLREQAPKVWEQAVAAYRAAEFR